MKMHERRLGLQNIPKEKVFISNKREKLNSLCTVRTTFCPTLLASPSICSSLPRSSTLLAAKATKPVVVWCSSTRTF